MRAVFLILVVCAVPAEAQECPAGSSEVLELKSWRAERGYGGQGTLLTVTYKNVSGKPIAMIDASLWFEDVLGGRVGSISLNREMTMPADAEQTKEHYVAGLHRLLTENATHFYGKICTNAVLYSDGSKVEF